MRLRLTQSGLAFAVLMVAMPLCAQSEWHDGFDSAEPTWQAAGSDSQYRVQEHRRVQDEKHSGQASEWLRIEGYNGTRIFFGLDVGQPRIIDELAPRIWVKADRPGLYLALRVVLPRTPDPRSGKPVTALLLGSTYTTPGRWQQLDVALPRTLLTRQIHLLRMQMGSQVDEREAYVDAVLLNVYAGPGITNLWIDDLELVGYAAVGTVNSQTAAQEPQVAAATWTTKSDASPEPGVLKPVRLPPVDASANDGPQLGATVRPLPPVGTNQATLATTPRPVQRKIKLSESVLLSNDKPCFPRVIQHRGEPLTVLKKLGFNAVWLQRMPTPEVFEEANRLGLWIICPPPAAADVPIAEIGSMFDSVLAWNLGNDLGDADLDAIERWEKQIRAADRRVNRPLICRPRTNLVGYSRIVDVLLIDRRPLGTSLEMNDYATWVQRQPLLARPNTPMWTTVQTQPNEAVRQQLLVQEPGSAPPLTVSPEQMRLLAYTAVASGSRGLLFLSDSPLDASDADTRQRAMALELLNLELELIEPWAAAGSLLAVADSNVREVGGAVLRTEHARLLLPIWSASMSQYVPPQSAMNALALTAPGVPEAYQAYTLTPSGVQSLPTKYGAGGMQVVLNEFDLTSQILMANDPLIINSVHRRAREIGRRSAELLQQLAVQKLNTVELISGQLSAQIPIAGAPNWLQAARRDLQQCDTLLSSGKVPEASLNAQRAMRSLRMVERGYWDVAVKGLKSPVTSAGAVSFETLPFHWKLVNRLTSCHFGGNRIAGGDFEDMNTMMRAGWRFFQHTPPSVQAAADLAPDAAHSGRFGLRLAATANDPKKEPAVIENPPALFTSPSIQVEAGQIVCIHGWVKVPEPIRGSIDGLLIVDSLSGEALANRIKKTGGWQQFAVYRTAPQSGAMCITFALSGMGEALIDDVAIQTVDGMAAVTQR